MTSAVEIQDSTFAEAVRLALEDGMRDDGRIVLLGQDIVVGFPFGVTRGLAERFGPDRVRDTPISEAATMGCGIGAALAGLRPVVEVDFSGFLLLGLDQLVNNGTKLRYMTGGQVRVPLVVRVGQGPIGSFGAQHSMALHGWLANVPGLAVCAPSHPQDAYDLMRWALTQDDPVVFAEDMRLYRTKGSLERRETTADVRTRVAKSGQDVTVVTFGHGVSIALEAAEELRMRGIDVEVLDLRLLAPFDEAAVGASVRRTGRALCVSDDPLHGGFAATLAVTIEDIAGSALRVPIARLGAKHVPVPYSRELERLVYPSAQSIEIAVGELCR